MANNIWQREEQKFLKAVKNVKIPNESLRHVDYATRKEIERIPNSGGCYWIWTNEPVPHTLHKNITPEPFGGGEIIYNGIAKDDVRGRVLNHLMGEIDAGWSGISLDIHFGQTISHRKKAISTTGKVPFLRDVDEGGAEKFMPIRERRDLLKLYLSRSEKQSLLRARSNRVYFRNGININDSKHKIFRFRVYYIIGLSSLYLEFIEKEWRVKYGLPKLCSYSSGR
jgi:hypothetical protein